MTLNCAIIDDEPLAVELLASYVKRTPFLYLTGGYNSAINAMKEIREKPVDILFLDIQTPELSGLEFAKYCLRTLESYLPLPSANMPSKDMKATLWATCSNLSVTRNSLT